MQLALIGVSHKTAPVEIRERLAFPSEKMRAALEALMERAKAGEAMILSTCNRVEIVTEGPSDELIRQFLYEYHRIGAEWQSDAHGYCKNGTDEDANRTNGQTDQGCEASRQPDIGS